MTKPNQRSIEAALRSARPVASGLDRLLPAEAEQAEILFRTTLRVRQTLRRIALDERSSVQALLVEAVNRLLVDRGHGPTTPDER